MTGEGPVRLGPQWQQRADVLARQGMAGAARRRSRLMRVESVLRFLVLGVRRGDVYGHGGSRDARRFESDRAGMYRHTGDRIVSFIIAVVACAVAGFALGYITGRSGPCDCCDVVDRG